MTRNQFVRVVPAGQVDHDHPAYRDGRLILVGHQVTVDPLPDRPATSIPAGVVTAVWATLVEVDPSDGRPVRTMAAGRVQAAGPISRSRNHSAPPSVLRVPNESVGDGDRLQLVWASAILVVAIAAAAVVLRSGLL